MRVSRHSTRLARSAAIRSAVKGGAAAAVGSIGAATKSETLGMSISVRARKVSVDRDIMWVDLDDGRSLGVPWVWFPWLMCANAGQRENYRIGYSGNMLHWEGLDEDISVEVLLSGRRNETRTGLQVA